MVKKLPKLRSRLVAPPRTDPPPAATTSTTDSTGTDKPAPTDEVSEKGPQDQLQDGPPKSDQPASSTGAKEKENIVGGAEANEKFVSEVSAVIGKIASFYGSGFDSGNTSGDANNDDKGGGPPSCDIMITSSPEVSSEQVAVTTTTTTTPTPPAPPPPTTPLLPSYAPENCATVVDSNYQPAREPSTNLPAKSEDELPALSDTIPPLVVDALPDPSEAEVSVDVAALESILVTEKEIFGDSGRMSDSGDSDDDIHDDGDGGGVAMETGMLNAEELAWIEAEFKKITAVPPLLSTTTTATAGETSSADKTAATQDKKPQVCCHCHMMWLINPFLINKFCYRNQKRNLSMSV